MTGMQNSLHIQRGKKMDNQEFKDKVAGERIAALLETSDLEQKEKELAEENAAVLDGLDMQTRQRIEAQMNRMIDRMVDLGQQAYMEGIKDGIKLMKWVQQL